MTTKEIQETIAKLEGDPTLGLLGPMRWMDNNQLQVLAIIDAGRAVELAEHTGISKAIILRWRRRQDGVPAAGSQGEIKDASWWQGNATGWREAFETLARVRA